MDKRIVLWFGDFPNNNALAWEIAEKFNVTGIIFERRKKTTAGKYAFRKLIEKVLGKILFHQIDKAWFHMLQHYKRQFPAYPDISKLFVENINSEEAYKFTSLKKPDLIMVSGTRLIKNKLLSLRPPIGIINLHTGLSPYVKGGPNCTNWCIANNDFHLIGNTVMWIDEGIDSGNIITTEAVHLIGSEDLNQIHLKVMEHAHRLYIKAVHVLINTPDLAPNVRQQNIAHGKTYYNNMWDVKQKYRLVRNLKKLKTIVQSDEYKRKRRELVQVPLCGSANTKTDS